VHWPLPELEDELELEELELDELELDELEELELLLVEEPSQAPTLLQELSLPGTVLVYQLA